MFPISAASGEANTAANLGVVAANPGPASAKVSRTAIGDVLLRGLVRGGFDWAEVGHPATDCTPRVGGVSRLRWWVADKDLLDSCWKCMSEAHRPFDCNSNGEAP